MTHPFITDPTPAQRAGGLKTALRKAGLYNVEDPDSSVTDLLADIMHLIDLEDLNDFDSQCLQARRHYTEEVNEQEDRETQQKEQAQS